MARRVEPLRRTAYPAAGGITRRPDRTTRARIAGVDDGSPGPGRGITAHPGRDDQTSDVILRLLRRLARLLIRASDTVMRWANRKLGEHAGAGRDDISPAQLRDLVASSRKLDREQRRLIDDVIAARERHVRELMVPRTEVSFLDAGLSICDAARVVGESRHSRFPVGYGSLDDVVGFVHLRDLLIRPEGDPPGHGRRVHPTVIRLPAGKPVLAALSEMRRTATTLPWWWTSTAAQPASSPWRI